MKALVTFASGPCAELLEIALPGFRSYADRHGYELMVFDDIPASRPASWFKVRALIQALRDHDEVLWLDADIVIVDDSEDLADHVSAGAWQAMVAHHTPDGEVPNHGVWFCRQPMSEVLDRIWAMTEYLHHPWWEQAAGMRLLGYDPNCRPTVFHGPTELYERTCFLPVEWNSHRDDEADQPRFWHATVRGDRAALMRKMADVERV